jgi:hypothetical protein
MLENAGEAGTNKHRAAESSIHLFPSLLVEITGAERNTGED